MRKNSLIFLLLVAPGCPCSGGPAQDGDRVSTVVCGTKVSVEIARSDSAHARGYMFRPNPPMADEGMIFIFSDESPRQFWMANVNFPLDILFFDRTGALVKTHTMAAEPHVPESLLRRYPSVIPAQFAVEVRAGWVADHKVAPPCNLQLTEKIKPLR